MVIPARVKPDAAVVQVPNINLGVRLARVKVMEPAPERPYVRKMQFTAS